MIKISDLNNRNTENLGCQSDYKKIKCKLCEKYFWGKKTELTCAGCLLQIQMKNSFKNFRSD